MTLLKPAAVLVMPVSTTDMTEMFSELSHTINTQPLILRVTLQGKILRMTIF